MKLVLIMTAYLGLLLSGQVLWKKGLQALPHAFQGTVAQAALSLGGSAYILAGIVIYGVATILWLYLLSKYDLSYIYPFTSLSFILAVAVSFVFLGETVTVNRWIGAAVIGAGVYITSLR